MKHITIEYHPCPQPGLLTDWLTLLSGRTADSAGEMEGATRIAGKGFARLRIELDGDLFLFASVDELDRCIAILSQKLLPSTRIETLRRGLPKGAHWLDRMPPWTKPWRYRQRAVKLFRAARERFVRETVMVPLRRARASSTEITG